MIYQIKNDLKMGRWVVMPPASEMFTVNAIFDKHEAIGYECLGAHSSAGTVKNSELAIKYFEKARTIYNNNPLLIGGLENMDTSIAMIKDLLANKNKMTFSRLESARYGYEQSLKRGSDSQDVLLSGVAYAEHLLHANHFIKAERLIVKLAAESRRLFSSEHRCTRYADEVLKKCTARARIVGVLHDTKTFQALRYENEGEICVVTGPIKRSRQIDEESIFHVESNSIIPITGCPVFCHGLVSESHLTGKLGEVRGRGDGNGMLLVLFEIEGGQMPVSVKPENLRVAFDFPAEE